jgi:hypothetical protein
MTLVDMLNEVLSQSGFLKRAGFAASNDPDDVQMISIANRAQAEIRDWYNWGELRTEHTVDMVTGQDQYTMPFDFSHLVPDSPWESTGSRQVELPTPNRRWYMYKFSPYSDGGTLRARFYGDKIEVRDVVGGESFTFEYMSNYAIRDAVGDPQKVFSKDDDTWILDDQLLILAIQAHWMQTKLMPQYTEMFHNYHRKLAEAISRSAGSRTLGGRSGVSRYDDGAPYTPLYLP